MNCRCHSRQNIGASAVNHPRVTLPKTKRCIRVVMVGHLREEKSPRTLFEAAALLEQHPIFTYSTSVQSMIRFWPTWRTKQRRFTPLSIHGCFNLFRNASSNSTLARAGSHQRHGGGAHVIMEAVCSGVPVIASRIPGNMGMLGEDYAGLFPVGDAKALADMLIRFRQDAKFEQLLKSSAPCERLCFRLSTNAKACLQSSKASCLRAIRLECLALQSSPHFCI